jgi:sugar-phosphatase
MSHRIACDALLFDLDGVLADTTELVERSWAQWAESRGLDTDFASRVHGRPTLEIVSDVAPELDARAEADDVERREEDGLDGITAVDGALELVASVPASSWAVVTSGNKSQAAARLGAIELKPPDVVITSEDVDNGKPHPAPYLSAARKLGVSPQECVVFEDAPAGIAAARAAGMASIAVTTTMDPQALEAADHVVSSLRQVRVESRDGRLEVVVEEEP